MEFTHILQSNNLSLTRSRLKLLEVLRQSGVPLSEKDLEEKMGQSCNRTTIYRNLSTLVAKGLIQRILSDNSVKFKLLDCRLPDEKKHDHVHFQCRSCQRIVCMEDLMVNDYNLPKGYVKIENQFLIIGICKACNDVGKS